MKKNYFIGLLLLCGACAPEKVDKKVPVTQADTVTTEVVEKARVPEDSCLKVAQAIQQSFYLSDDTSGHWQREIELPAKGQFAQESHYVTTNDRFNNERLFANAVTENIDRHLLVGYHIYKEFDPAITQAALYEETWEKEWTPAESGSIGQGSIGERQKSLLYPETELWLMTMMWAKGERPEVGTKYVVWANGKAVVVVAGFETGPRYERYLGGLTPEVHHWLGTDAYSEINVAYLKDQTLAAGPIKCWEK